MCFFSVNYWRSLNLSLVAVNCKDMPTIWLFMDLEADGWGVKVIGKTDQQITIEFSFQNKLCRISFVYVGSTYIKRRDLWADLIWVKHNNRPWMALGDFRSSQSYGQFGSFSCVL